MLDNNYKKEYLIVLDINKIIKEYFEVRVECV